MRSFSIVTTDFYFECLCLRLMYQRGQQKEVENRCNERQKEVVVPTSNNINLSHSRQTVELNVRSTYIDDSAIKS